MIVSIITITYNSAQTLEQTLLSVEKQTYPQIEHIIIDGGSTDGTLTLVEAHRSRISKVVSEPDKGIYDALNKGIRLATGDVVGLLNSDDLLASNHAIEDIVHAFEQSDVDVVYGDLDYYDITASGEQLSRHWRSNTFRSRDLRYGWMPPHPTLYCRRDVFEEHGVYNDTYRISGDYDFILRVFCVPTLKSIYLPKVLVKMRVGGVSNRNMRNILQKMREDYCILRAHHLPACFTLFCKNIRKIRQFFRR